jgi:phytoene synthase
MSGRELDAAGIVDAGLRRDYAACRELAARHGRTYFLATQLLPIARRPAVHALYGFARAADEIVDDLGATRSLAERRAALDAFAGDFAAGQRSRYPVVRAVADTARRYGIDAGLFADFLFSMRMDLTVRDYATFADLMTYVHGSAEVIGLQMLPVLGTVGAPEDAAPYAAALGVAFQLTNFIRDVGEDLRRGRIYLPQDAMHAHGVDRERLLRGVVDGPIRRWLAAEIDRTRAIYRRAEPGIARLAPVARPCLRAAFILYGDILTAVERAEYQVLDRRVSVDGRRRARVAAGGYARAVTARRRAARARPTSTTSR